MPAEYDYDHDEGRPPARRAAHYDREARAAMQIDQMPATITSHRLCQAISSLHPSVEVLDRRLGELIDRLSEVTDSPHGVEKRLETVAETDPVELVAQVLGVAHRLDVLAERMNELQSRIVV